MNLNESNFEESVVKSSVPVLVDFWAEWCGPCLHVGPTIEKVGKDYEGKAKVFKVNIDQEQGLASKYKISSIPALLFFKDGEVAKTLFGVQSEELIKENLDSLMGKNDG